MALAFTTLTLVVLFHSSVTNGMKWKKYKGSTDADPDRALLVALFGPQVKLHENADTGVSAAKSTLLAIIFSLSEPNETVYACAVRMRAASKGSNPPVSQILSVTHFYPVNSTDKDGKATIKLIQTEANRQKYTWNPPDASSSSNGLVAVMRSNYDIQFVLEQNGRGESNLHVHVSSLRATTKDNKTAQDITTAQDTATTLVTTTIKHTYNFEVDFRRGPYSEAKETLVNYFGGWTESQIEMDRNVSDYFSDPERGSKDARVRSLLDQHRKQYTVTADSGALVPKGSGELVAGGLELKLYTVWRVAVDRYGDIPVVAICAAVSGTDRFGADKVLSYIVIEIRIHPGGAFTASGNPPTTEAGASDKAAQLISFPDSIARGNQAALTTNATTTRQIKGVVQ